MHVGKSIEEIKDFYEKKYGKKVRIIDFQKKDVLLKYIEKWELYSSSADLIFSLLYQKERVSSDEKG